MPSKVVRHYKGGMYLILGHATVEATGDLVVVYQSLPGLKLWARPHAEFYGSVVVEGKRVLRFAEVKE